MHRALSIPEILQLILSSGISTVTARNVALTCRMWKELALDRLWRDLDSVFPLLWVLVPLKVDQVFPEDEKTIWVSTFFSHFGSVQAKQDVGG